MILQKKTQNNNKAKQNNKQTNKQKQKQKQNFKGVVFFVYRLLISGVHILVE